MSDQRRILSQDWNMSIDKALANIRGKHYEAIKSIEAALLKVDQLGDERGLSTDSNHTFSKLRMFLVDARDRLKTA